MCSRRGRRLMLSRPPRLRFVVDRQEVVAAWGAHTSTVFQAASISKPVAVALRLVAEHCLDLDADVNQFLTSWQLPGDAGADPVTVRYPSCHGAARVITVDRKVVEIAGHLYLEARSSYCLRRVRLVNPTKWRRTS
jgi:hypothetical protein